MGTATADSIFWAFVNYVRGNRHKSPGGMTIDDFNNMVTLFAANNTTEVTTTGTGTLTDAEWPTIGGSTVVASYTQVVKDQAAYPESHKGA